MRRFSTNRPPRGGLLAPGLLLIALLAALAAASGCEKTKKSSFPNVLLISVDTLRADRLGCYGGAAGITGMMDFWAQRGVRFANAWSAAPWTLPSHASAMTGLYPTEHRAIDDKINIDKSAPMLAERLHAAGFVTAAYVSHYYLGEEYGFGRGFDDFYITPGAKADEMVAKASRWVQRRKPGKPFFLFLHLFDAHSPYQPPVDIAKKHYPADVDFLVAGTTKDIMSVVNEWPSDTAKKKLRALRSLYEGSIEFVDKQLEVLFKSLQDEKLDQNTLIILMSDHGEEFMEHGLMEHGFSLYQEQLRVPFIWYYPPGLPSGNVVETPASLIDLMPTLLDFLHLPPVEKISGKSLKPLLLDPAAAFPPRLLLAETRRQGPDRVAAIKDFKKYVYSPPFRLNGRLFEEKFFNLRDDPGELKNLFGSNSVEAQKLAGEMFESGLYVLRRVWHLQWGAAKGDASLKGEVRTDGKIVYLYKENTIYDTDDAGLLVSTEFPWNKTDEKKITFVNIDPTVNGFSFSPEPETAPITVQLYFNGKEDASRIWLGGPKNKASAGHFTLDRPVALEPGAQPPPGGVLIWCDGVWVNAKQVLRAQVGDPIKLAPQVVERLRSLGYLQ
jgi:arylsulfatase A-like enzyme